MAKAPSVDRMSAFTIFRISIVASLIFTIAGVAYTMLAEPTFPEVWRDMLTWNGTGAIFPFNEETPSGAAVIALCAFGLFGLVLLINQVMLFFYWRPSRRVYLFGCLLAYPLTLTFGVTVFTPIDFFLLEMATFFQA